MFYNWHFLHIIRQLVYAVERIPHGQRLGSNGVLVVTGQVIYIFSPYRR